MQTDGITLTAAFGCYRLDLPEGTWVDLFAVESGAQDAEEALAAGELDQARAAAESAESLARRPFLPGEDGAWVEAEAARARRHPGPRAERARRGMPAFGDAQDAAKWAEQAIALAPFRETGYRRLMEAHAAAGNRAEALQVYEQCRQLLAEELGAYPSPETDSIYRALLEAPQTPVRATPPVVEPSVEPGEPELSQLQTELPALRAKKVTERPSRKRRAVLFSALSGVIAAAVAVPLFAFSSGGSRATQLDGTLGGNAVGAVSASTGHIFAAIPLSASPDAIAAGAGSIWVAMSDRGAVSRIDPATNTVQQTIPTPGGPSALTVGGGFVWVADTLAGTVARIDPRANGGQVVGKPIRVGNGPSGIAYGLGAVWVANSVDRTVIRIDPVTGTPGRPISVEDGADGVAAGDGSVWVIGRSAGRSLAHRSGGAHGRRHDERRERARRRRRRPRRRVGGERGGRDGVEDRSLEWAPGRCLPGRQAAERHRRRSGRPRLGCQRRLGDPDRARPRDGPRDPDRPDRRAARRGRARRRDGVRRGPGAAERAPRRHAHARHREPARPVRAADPDRRSIPPPATRRGSSSR